MNPESDARLPGRGEARRSSEEVAGELHENRSAGSPIPGAEGGPTVVNDCRISWRPGGSWPPAW